MKADTKNITVSVVRGEFQHQDLVFRYPKSKILALPFLCLGELAACVIGVRVNIEKIDVSGLRILMLAYQC